MSRLADKLIDTPDFYREHYIDDESYYQWLMEKRVSEPNEQLWEEETKDNRFVDGEGNVLEG